MNGALNPLAPTSSPAPASAPAPAPVPPPPPPNESDRLTSFPVQALPPCPGTPGKILFMPHHTPGSPFQQFYPSFMSPNPHGQLSSPNSTPMAFATGQYLQPGCPVTGFVLAPPGHGIAIDSHGYLSPAGMVRLDPNISTIIPTPDTRLPSSDDDDEHIHGMKSCVTEGENCVYSIDPLNASAWFQQSPALAPSNFTPCKLTNTSVDSEDDHAAIVMKARSITEHLIVDSDVNTAVRVLQASLALLGYELPSPEYEKEVLDIPGNASCVPGVKLVHPDEFRNPSTFLKIYGDPLCFSKMGPLPRKDRNGNWECGLCGNINFPRRFRCNMCNTSRGDEGDRIVNDYAKQVYERYVALFRQQKGAVDPFVATPEGINVHQQGTHKSSGSVRGMTTTPGMTMRGRGRRNQRGGVPANSGTTYQQAPAPTTHMSKPQSTVF